MTIPQKKSTIEKGFSWSTLPSGAMYTMVFSNYILCLLFSILLKKIVIFKLRLAGFLHWVLLMSKSMHCHTNANGTPQSMLSLTKNSAVALISQSFLFSIFTLQESKTSCRWARFKCLFNSHKSSLIFSIHCRLTRPHTHVEQSLISRWQMTNVLDNDLIHSPLIFMTLN